MGKDKISDERLHAAYLGSAELVAMYGEAYLPIFERLEQECKKREAQIALLTKARNISSKNKTN